MKKKISLKKKFCLRFAVLFFYLSRTFRCLSSLSCLYRQQQGDEWVVIGYHLKRLPKSAKNFGVTELELTGLLVNNHGFMQLLCNRYFEVLVDHKAIEYMVKSKTESPTTRPYYLNLASTQ